MSVIRKVVTLLRSSAREIGDSIVDANAIRIYEQEIHDAKRNIEEARNNLTAVMAEKIHGEREIERLRREIERFENLAAAALDRNENGLAEEIATKVAELEQERDQQSLAGDTYVAQIGKFKELIKTADTRIRQHEREIAMARTAESVYRATRSISANLGNSGSMLTNARQSLERIKQRHEALADRIAATEQLDRELGYRAMENTLAAAGIASLGNDGDRTRQILERVRARQAGTDDPHPAK